ncbi:MAG: hypothetical protein H7Y31_14545 [Chitinophagaceae bacterium]|nr:hypothetical protein [Chitinophagaceae bacterium]
MKAPNRDLLVLVKDEFLNSTSMEVELERIHQLLVGFETATNLCQAHEIFDMNRYKILRKQSRIQAIISKRELKPFVFIINKN